MPASTGRDGTFMRRFFLVVEGIDPGFREFQNTFRDIQSAKVEVQVRSLSPDSVRERIDLGPFATAKKCHVNG
jgi:hypothetical protein